MHSVRQFGLITMLSLAAVCTVAAPDLENLYINPEQKDKPEAVIFYNSANTCETCAETINRLISVLRKNYRGQMHAYLIDTARHPEFIRTFKLRGPLNLVLIRISDGASFGYAKLAGLQNETDDKTVFAEIITEKIANFLNLQPEN